MGFTVVIPARYASTRLPAKPLLEIGGRPMIQWVIDAALQSGADEVLVATDDARIAAVARDGDRSIGVMTRAEHLSGTDRLAEVAVQRGWDEQMIVVNVQGDEPMLPPALIRQVVEHLERHTEAGIATLSTPITSLREFLDPNVVKVVTDHKARALYFSRAPIPWHRDGATTRSESLASSGQTLFAGAQRHLGLYAYRVHALRKLTALAVSHLEGLEKLEQLRALQAGVQILVSVAAHVPPPGVDTPEDLERVRALLRSRA